MPLLPLLLLLASPLRPERAVAPPTAPPSIGIGINVPDASPEARQAALDTVRRTGATFFALELSWSAAEPRPREYRLDEVTRAARLLRQSGATLHLSIPLVTESARDVPGDLTDTAFDDPKLSLRLGRLLDALTPVLLDVQTLSLGDAADTYFADKPDELRAYRRLFDGAVQFLQKKAPRLLVGVTTAASSTGAAPSSSTRTVPWWRARAPPSRSAIPRSWKRIGPRSSPRRGTGPSRFPGSATPRRQRTDRAPRNRRSSSACSGAS
jgi:hypothetical protein